MIGLRPWGGLEEAADAGCRARPTDRKSFFKTVTWTGNFQTNGLCRGEPGSEGELGQVLGASGASRPRAPASERGVDGGSGAALTASHREAAVCGPVLPSRLRVVPFHRLPAAPWPVRPRLRPMDRLELNALRGACVPVAGSCGDSLCAPPPARPFHRF